MICELCGAVALSGFRVRVEGTVLNACRNCASGKDVVSEVSHKKDEKPKKKAVKAVVESFEVGDDLAFVDGFGEKIRHAREKAGLTQEDLGQKVNESHSLIHRIELGKFEPSKDLAKAIEKSLKIKILSNSQDAGDFVVSSSESKEITLGDMIVVRKRKK